MKLSTPSTTLFVALLITLMVALAAAGPSTFTFNNFSPVSDIISFELDFAKGIIQPKGPNFLKVYAKFYGLDAMKAKGYAYGLVECDSMSFTTKQLSVEVDPGDFGVAHVDFTNLSFTPPSGFFGGIVSIKIIGSFQAKIRDDASRVFSSGYLYRGDSPVSQWDSTYAESFLNKPLVESFDFKITDNVDPFGRKYKAFKLIGDGVNPLLASQALTSLALIEDSPNQPGHAIKPGRFSLIDPQSTAGCIDEKTGIDIPVALSPWSSSNNVLSLDKNFFTYSKPTSFVISCKNLGFYAADQQKFVSPSDQGLQRLQEQIGLTKNADVSTPTILRLLAIAGDNQRFVSDRWINIY